LQKKFIYIRQPHWVVLQDVSGFLYNDIIAFYVQKLNNFVLCRYHFEW